MTAGRTERKRAAKILGLPEDFEQKMYLLPKTSVTLAEAEEADWLKKHRHADVYTGAIGGHMMTLLTHTSIGDLRTRVCTICREHAYVAEPL